jgi:hypothetical protein
MIFRQWNISSDNERLEKRKKAPKGKSESLGAFTLDLSENPTFSFYAPEG